MYFCCVTSYRPLSLYWSSGLQLPSCCKLQPTESEKLEVTANEELFPETKPNPVLFHS